MTKQIIEMKSSGGSRGGSGDWSELPLSMRENYLIFNWELLEKKTHTPNNEVKGLVSIRVFSWDLNILIIFWAQIAT